MAQLILFNKPFRVMSQFSPSGDKATLAQYIDAPNFYPAGRLDFDSEGLLLLTDDGALQHCIAHPSQKLPKTYWVQVEGESDTNAVARLCEGVSLNDGPTQPAQVRFIDEPELWPRIPPIRVRQSIPTHWLEIIIREGRNRQIRRMTAAVGLPTLRLVRVAIGAWKLADLQPGEWRCIDVNLPPTTKPRLTITNGAKPTAGRRRQRV
jgi:23S rRNA pseudouridine2457 synthase